MTEFATLRCEDRGDVRVVILDRPKVLNAIDATVVDELARAIESAATSGKRGLVLTGAGKAFAAGADISAMAEMTRDEALAFAEKGHAVGDMLARIPMCTIAAVGGFALGGGCELALACDFVYASTRAKFGQPEVKLGVIPGFGGTQRLARRVGLARALELCMTGEIIDAEEALRIGLVNRLCEPDALLDAAVATAQKIAEQGPLAVARVKDVLHRGIDMPLAEANRLEQEAFAALFDTADQKEGMKAFLEKRPPNFTGK
ncbi:MAG: crotonase [Deltaproteobacteria bacterium]|nr:MAG: crotonase [Deltaproteobacteria bacterium]